MTEDDLDQADKDVRFRCFAELQLAEKTLCLFLPVCYVNLLLCYCAGVIMLVYIYFVSSCKNVYAFLSVNKKYGQKKTLNYTI